MNKNLFDITSAASIGAAAEKLTKFNAIKRKGNTSTKNKPAAQKKQAAAPKEPKAKVTTPPRDPRAIGKEATHKRSADTGKVSKLTPNQKAAVDKYNSPRQFIKATPPPVDLTDIT